MVLHKKNAYMVLLRLEITNGQAKQMHACLTTAFPLTSFVVHTNIEKKKDGRTDLLAVAAEIQW